MSRFRNPSIPILLSILLLLSLSTHTVHGRGQGEALRRLNRAKWKRLAGGVDTSLFDVSRGSETKESLADTALDTEAVVSEARLVGAEANNDQRERDRIERLPGKPLVDFTQYGGYVTVDRTAGRSMYYYFTEAHYNSHSMPLLLWLNGGTLLLLLLLLLL